MRRLSISMLLFAAMACAEPANTLAANFEAALNDTKVRQAITISLSISGGLPAEAYYLDLRVFGDGTVRYEYTDVLRSFEQHVGETALPEGNLVALLRTILASKFFNAAEGAANFVPGTTIGKLEMTDGTSVFLTHFVADKAQAESQNALPALEVTSTVDAFLDLAAQVIGVESVEP